MAVLAMTNSPVSDEAATRQPLNHVVIVEDSG